MLFCRQAAEALRLVLVLLDQTNAPLTTPSIVRALEMWSIVRTDASRIIRSRRLLTRISNNCER